MAAAFDRLRAWTATLPVPEGRRITFEKLSRFDPETGMPEDEGWRTYLVERATILTGRDIEGAEARLEQSPMTFGGWQVHLQLTPEGGAAFEEATARLIKRRIAILLDGVTQSAPVIMSRIPGSAATITMGSGTPEEQGESARRLAAVLRSGAMPGPLEPVAFDVEEPPLDPAVIGNLVRIAALVLAGEMVFLLWGALRSGSRKPRARQAPTPAS